MHLMQSRGGQKIQRARRMHTAKRKDLQQAELEGWTIFNFSPLLTLAVQAKT